MIVTWKMPTKDQHAALAGIDGVELDESYKDLAAAAVVRIDDPNHPLSGTPTQIAQVAGLTLAGARKRATDKGLTHRP